MRIAILGYGQEGKSAKHYFEKLGYDIQIFDNFTTDELSKSDFSNFDLVLRSPSVPPHTLWRRNRTSDPQNHTSSTEKHTSDSTDYTPNSKNHTLDSQKRTPEFSSCTQYFFTHCQAPIIGITGTKGKGTTCSLVTAILQKLGKKVWLVGNIGKPALDVLDEIAKTDVVVYELSSFQLWDLKISPHIAGILRIEPDHLNIHKDFNDYLQAKGNIARFQTTADACVFCRLSDDSTQLSQLSPGQKIPYPLENPTPELNKLLDQLTIPGQHNRENAQAALLIAASFYQTQITDFIHDSYPQLAQAFTEFKGLPYRIEFLRELNHVKYYDDNFSTTLPSLEVALAAFPKSNIIAIVGGRDKTNNAALPEIAHLLQAKATFAILIGESGKELAKILPENNFTLAETLPAAVKLAQEAAEKIQKSQQQDTIVLMSPAAASFDMFHNVYDRGNQFQTLVKELK